MRELRPQYQIFLSEAAADSGMSENRVIEQALALYQLHVNRAERGFHAVYMNMAGERDPMDIRSGCMGDD
jgi:hypothetical protein